MTPENFVEAYNTHGSVKAVHRELGISYRQARNGYTSAVKAGLMSPIPVGRKTREETKTPVLDMPPVIVRAVPRTKVRRYILTCAQNDTPVNKPVWNNLMALANYYDAQIHVARFTYIKSGLGALGDKAQYTKKESVAKGLSWDPALSFFFSDASLELAPDLIWCGEMNILPTAVNPLSGLTVYTGRKSSIFPHTKIAMESVADFNDNVKFVYTTGAVTEKNYIQRKAGLKAQFHHCYGGMLVEVREDGTWFARHLNADKTGSIYDLNIKAEGGFVTFGHRVEAINWGDLHEYCMDDDVRVGGFAKGGMLDALRPKYQFFHDAVDFFAKNPHIIKRKLYHDLYRVHRQGPGTVEAEFQSLAKFLTEAALRPWCETIMVDSNHHRMFSDWLHIGDYRTDPKNARFFLEAQKWCYDQMHENPEVKLNLLKWAVEREIGVIEGIRYLDQDESFILCPEAGGGIECGMHGHQGINGARGNPRSLSRMGHKANTGHTHSASIVDGIYTAGTSSRLRMGYNTGPSSWSHSHILTYSNGKRSMVTMRKGDFRA